MKGKSWFLAAALALPAAANAETFQYYAFYNGSEIAALLNFIALVMGGSDFLGLVKTVALLGLILATIAALFRLRGEQAATFIIGFALFYGLLFVPKGTVVVNDVPRGTTTTVANVPYGVGFIGGAVSQVGWWLTRTYDQNISMPNDVKYSNTGMVFGARVYDNLNRLRIRDANLTQDMILFIRDCVNPELVDRPAEVQQVASSQDIWTYIGTPGWLNPGRVTSSVLSPGTVITCPNAHTLLTARINVEVDNQASYLGRKLNPDGTRAQSDAAVRAVVYAYIPAIEGVFGVAARTAQQAIQQALVSNMLREGQGTIAEMLQYASLNRDQIAAALADSAAITSYGTQYQIAQQQLPRLRTLIEGTVLATFPIVFLMVVAAGMYGGKAIQTYVGAALWVQLWAPLFAIVNWFVTSRTADVVNAAIASSSGATSPNLLNQMALITASQGEVAIAGMLALSVPAIALAIAMGGIYAVSGVVSSVMGTAVAAADRAGAAAGVGSFSGANVQWGTASMNAMSANAYSSGFNFRGADTGSIATPYGNATMDMGTGAWTGGTGVDASYGGIHAGGQTRYGRSDEGYASTSGGWRSGESADTARSKVSSMLESDGHSLGRSISGALQSQVGAANLFNSSLGGASSVVGSRTGTAGTQSSEGSQFNWNSSGGFNASRGEISTTRLPGGSSPEHGLLGLPGAIGEQIGTPGTAAPTTGGGRSSGAGPLSSMFNRWGLSASMGGSAQDTSGLVNSVLDQNSAMNASQRTAAAHAINNALDNVIGSTTDQGQRQRLRAFQAAFNEAFAATSRAVAETSQSAEAGERQSQGRSNAVVGGFNAAPGEVLGGIRDALAARGLIGPDAGPREVMRALHSAPSSVRAAVAAAAQGTVEGTAGNAVLGSGGARPPGTTAEGVVAAGQAIVDNLGASGARQAGAVATGNASFVQSRAEAGGVPGLGMPDQTPAQNAFGDASRRAVVAVSNFTQAAALEAGITKAAGALSTANDPGILSTLSRAYLFGAGTTSPGEARNRINAALIAENNRGESGLRDYLISIGDDRASGSKTLKRDDVSATVQSGERRAASGW